MSLTLLPPLETVFLLLVILSSLNMRAFACLTLSCFVAFSYHILMVLFQKGIIDEVDLANRGGGWR